MPEVVINGPEGRIEARYQKAASPTAPVALVMHPHPRFGGTMNNKVVYNVFHALSRSGFAVLRFNFRGVGKSQGAIDNGQGELADAAAALDWLQTFHPNASQTWVGGFSFGAWIAMQLLMRRPEINAFVAVAPPANIYDFAFLAPCPSSGLIIQGTGDEVVPEPEVAKLANRLKAQRGSGVEYKTIPGASHFFEGKLDELSAVIDRYADASVRA
ncbi:MAG: alpha/beta fold hydrolase [Alphaproteobacteria bacterium]|nr:alpha/beta fold hydrolase [Alphaproteobacteria bacterium]